MMESDEIRLLKTVKYGATAAGLLIAAGILTLMLLARGAYHGPLLNDVAGFPNWMYFLFDGMRRLPRELTMESTIPAGLVDGAPRTVIAGTHKGKSGTATSGCGCGCG